MILRFSHILAPNSGYLGVLFYPSPKEPPSDLHNLLLNFDKNLYKGKIEDMDDIKNKSKKYYSPIHRYIHILQ